MDKNISGSDMRTFFRKQALEIPFNVLEIELTVLFYCTLSLICTILFSFKMWQISVTLLIVISQQLGRHFTEKQSDYFEISMMKLEIKIPNV